MERLNPNEIVSADGFGVRIRCVPCSVIEYSEGERVAQMDFDSDYNHMILHADRMRGWLPTEDSMTLDEKAIVLGRIEKALSVLLTIPFEIHRSPRCVIEGDRLASEEGYSVEVISSVEVKYSEGQRYLLIDRLPDEQGKRVIRVSMRRTYWSGMCDKEQITFNYLNLIIQRVASSMEKISRGMVIVRRGD